MEEKKTKKVDTVFRTKQDIIDYVMGMNTHVIIWANGALNQMNILKDYLGEKKIKKDWGLKSSFIFLEANLKTVMDLVNRMEKDLKNRK